MRAALENGPIIATVRAGNDLFRHYHAGIIDGEAIFNLGCDSKFQNHDFDHAVTIVGYGATGRTPYVVAKNSFGTSWGQKGYAKFAINNDGEDMKYGACGIMQNMYQPVINVNHIVREEKKSEPLKIDQ